MKKNRNIYMGPKSTAKLPVRGRVDEDWEILLNTFATAYDAANNIMLTRSPGVFDPATDRELRGRFAILKLLAKKHSPDKLNAIKYLEKLSLDNLHGKLPDRVFLQKVREVCRKEGLRQDLINQAERNINAAERATRQSNMARDMARGKPRQQQPRRPQQRQKPNQHGILEPLFSPNARNRHPVKRRR
jgi:hypothetical protein